MLNLNKLESLKVAKSKNVYGGIDGGEGVVEGDDGGDGIMVKFVVIMVVKLDIRVLALWND